jgi:hypothetical protein
LLGVNPLAEEDFGPLAHPTSLYLRGKVKAVFPKFLPKFLMKRDFGFL